ncbi:MAG: glycosidase, partial [Bacteroidales bacterium]
MIENKYNHLSMQVTVTRKDTSFSPDPSRVIARFHYTGDERSGNIIRKVLAMSENEINVALSQVLRSYSKRHRNISRIFERHFNKVTHLLNAMQIDPQGLDTPRKVLIGSYFTKEYSIESAAFFNPSIVEHPDQTELAPGEKRVILSFRATGEGHISSIVFRTGVLDKDNNLDLEEVGQMLDEAEIVKRYVYAKDTFMRKLDEMQNFNNIVPPALVFDKLGDTFTYGELERCVKETRHTLELSATKEMLLNQIMWLASSHYEIEFSLDTALSERVIFPISEAEKNGIEDARFVKFTDDDGQVMYYATYTAYNGISILPKLLETKTFYHF